MNRIKPSHAFALPLALLLGFATPSAPALAGWQQDGATYTYPNGEKTTWYQDTNDPDKYCIYWEHNGLVTLVFLDFGKSDPGPDDASGKGTEKPDIAELIKLDKSGKGYTVTLAPENTKLSKWITGGGFGFGPHGNPGDQDTGTGPGKTPVHSNSVDKTAAEIKLEIRTLNQVARDLQSFATSMGSGDEGGGENTPGFNKSNNGNNGGGVNKTGNYTEGQNKTIGKTESLGRFPQLVNPPPKSKVRATGPRPETREPPRGSREPPR